MSKWYSNMLYLKILYSVFLENIFAQIFDHPVDSRLSAPEENITESDVTAIGVEMLSKQVRNHYRTSSEIYFHFLQSDIVIQLIWLTVPA